MSFFWRKADNIEEATHYRNNLILALNHYKIILFTDDRISDAPKKYELILMFIHFQFNFHKVSKMNEATIAKISKKFAVHLKKQNRPDDYITEHKMILQGFFEFITENYKNNSV